MLQKFKLPEVRYAFYDVIARIVPGVIFLLVASVITIGPKEFFVALSVKDNALHLFSAAMLPLLLVMSYFTGVILNQIWLSLEQALNQIWLLLKKVFRSDGLPAERKAKKACLEELEAEKPQGSMFRLIHDAKKNLNRLPAIHRMLEKLRYYPEGDAERFLKLRAEQRMCEASAAGFGLNSIYLLYIWFTSSIYGREQGIVVAVAIIIGFVISLLRAHRQRQKFFRGVCSAWLNHFGLSVLPQLMHDTSNGHTTPVSFEIRQETEIRIAGYKKALLSIPALDDGTVTFKAKDLLTPGRVPDERKYTLDEHLAHVYRKDPTAKGKDLALFGLRNTLVNGRAIAIAESYIYAVDDEEPKKSKRPYYGIAFRSGQLSLETVLGSGYDMNNLPEYFVSGIPVLWDDQQEETLQEQAPPDLILTETYDHSHVYDLPRGNHPAANKESRETWEQLNEVFKRFRYNEVAVAAAAMRSAVAAVTPALRRNSSYLHSIIGMDKQGRIINIVAHGRLEALGNHASALGCTRAICVENSGSIMPTYVKGGGETKPIALMRAPNFRESGRAVLIIDLGEKGFKYWRPGEE